MLKKKAKDDLEGPKMCVRSVIEEMHLKIELSGELNLMPAAPCLKLTLSLKPVLSTAALAAAAAAEDE